MKKTIAAICLAVLLGGCVSTLTLQPTVLDGQQRIYQQGIESVISTKKVVVAIRPSSSTFKSQARPTVIISVFNRTDEPFDLSTEDIEAFADGHPLKVFTYEELTAEIKSRQAWAAVAAALNGAAQSMNAANAGYRYQSGTFNGSVYGSNGYSAYGSGSYSGYTYDPAAAQQAQAAANAQTQANLETINNETENALRGLSSTILRRTTVLPRTWAGGYVTLAKMPPDQPHEIRIVVHAAGEQHEFLLRQVRLPSQ